MASKEQLCPPPRKHQCLDFDFMFKISTTSLLVWKIFMLSKASCIALCTSICMGHYFPDVAGKQIAILLWSSASFILPENIFMFSSASFHCPAATPFAVCLLQHWHQTLSVRSKENVVMLL